MLDFDPGRPGIPVLHVCPLAPGMGHTLGAALQRGLRVGCDQAPPERLDYIVRDTQFKGCGGVEDLRLSMRGADRQRFACLLALSAKSVSAALAEWLPDEIVHRPACAPVHPLMVVPIDELGLGVRSFNCLRQGGIVSIGDLIGRTEPELLKLPYLGRRGLQEIKAALADRGLLLGRPSVA